MEPQNPAPNRNNNPTVEESPHSVEDMGATNETNEEKINRLLATAVTVREELHAARRKIIIGLVIAGLTFLIALAFVGGVLWGIRSQAHKLTDIATVNQENGVIARENSEAIKAATGPDARARSAAATNAVIADLRRSIDCAALYINDERYEACEMVTERLDSIRAGENPFEGA